MLFQFLLCPFPNIAVVRLIDTTIPFLRSSFVVTWATYTMGRNRTWTREPGGGGFDPLGRLPPRGDRPYSHPNSKGKGKGKGEGKGGGGGGHMDKMTTKLLNLYCQKKWNAQAGMLDLSGLHKAEVCSCFFDRFTSYLGCCNLHLWNTIDSPFHILSHDCMPAPSVFVLPQNRRQVDLRKNKT